MVSVQQLLVVLAMLGIVHSLSHRNSMTANTCHNRRLWPNKPGDTFCTYTPPRGENIRVSIGEHHKDKRNCRDCTCTFIGLQCCSYGIEAPIPWHFPWCKLVIDRADMCMYNIVCPTG